MAEPTYEELKARLAELEKKGTGRRTGQLDFRVGEKGAGHEQGCAGVPRREQGGGEIEVEGVVEHIFAGWMREAICDLRDGDEVWCGARLP